MLQGKNKSRITVVFSAAIIVLIIFLGLYIPRSQVSTPTNPSSTPTSTPIVANVKPVTPQYLPYENGSSKIFLISVSPTYGYYPGPSVPQMGSAPGIQKGDPSFIVNVTIRNDYSAENPLPDQNIFNMSNPDANVYMTAQIFNAQGQVKATDVTPPYPTVPLAGARTSLASGENATVTIYLSTSQRDIDHFQIILEYVGSVPAP
jgi:hypothetical protein